MKINNFIFLLEPVRVNEKGWLITYFGRIAYPNQKELPAFLFNSPFPYFGVFFFF
jgi:hypothetical protein